MTAGKMNSFTECPLDGTPRATLTKLLEDKRAHVWRWGPILPL
jgi:hypothetical protein